MRQEKSFSCCVFAVVSSRERTVKRLKCGVFSWELQDGAESVQSQSALS